MLQSRLLLAFTIVGALHLSIGYAQTVPSALLEDINRLVDDHEQQAIDWRRDIHQHPELSNQEYRTANMVADHLKRLGFEVQTNVAKTGVVGLLRGPVEGPVIALRADMDALPITEETGLPFASNVTATVNGEEVGVMHACGHDLHTASLMGVATVLASLRDQLPGSIKFIFQPAEEGAFEYDSWGAKLMVEEGVLENPTPNAIFGMHVWPMETGTIGYTNGAIMASVDNFSVRVEGRGGHAAAPWETIDPIAAASSMVLGMQTLVSRNAELTKGAAVVSVGALKGGNRNNIIPDNTELLGTIRTHNEDTREAIHRRLHTFCNHTARSFGATAHVAIDRLYPAVINDGDLVRSMLPVIGKSVGMSNAVEMDPLMVAEDFSYYANEIPGMFFLLGVTPSDHEGPVASPHSSRFDVDESSMAIAMRTMSYLAVEALYHFGE